MASETITIRRHDHRSLYNTNMDAYVSPDGLPAIFEDNEDFVVHKACSGENIAGLVLKQIIVQRGGHG